MAQRYGFLSLLVFGMLSLSCAKSADNSRAPVDYNNWSADQGNQAVEPECTYPNGNQNQPHAPIGIIGGQEVQGNSWVSQGIVMIVQKYSDADGSSHSSICTGSLVDQNVILTAAHCVDQSRASNPTNLSVYFSNKPECENLRHTLDKKKRTVSAVRIHPFWSPEDTRTENRGDIALIRIRGKAPKPYKPLNLAKGFIAMPESAPVLIAGYGMVNPNYYGDFGGPISLRVGQAQALSGEERQMLLDLLRNSDEVNGSPAEFNNSESNEMLYIDQTHGQGICAGDSGGPALMKNPQGQSVITGVASFVMNPYDSSLLCGYVAAHTSVIYHHDWLERTFQELKNSDSQKQTLF